MEIAGLIVETVRLYGLLGLGVAIVFLLIGMDRIDEDASGAYSFRLLLIPGIIVLWPIVCVRWVTLERARRRSATSRRRSLL